MDTESNLIDKNKKELSDTKAYYLMTFTGFCTLCSWNVILSIMDFFDFFVSLKINFS